MTSNSSNNNQHSQTMKKLFFVVLLCLLAVGTKAQIATGYRGFVDAGYGISVSKVSIGGYEADISDQLFLSTSHGYQIIPQLFVGGGAGVTYYHEGSTVAFPVFAHVRTDFGSRLGFFAEVKGGYTIKDIDGAFFVPTVGIRYGITDRLGINLGVGYMAQKVSGMDGTSGSVNIKVGIDF